MRSKLVIILALIVAGLLVFSALAEDTKKEEAPEYDYIGAKKCGLKPCHGKDGIMASWEETPHATAYDDLTDEQKADESLMKFYTTGTTKKGDVLTGVQCEACHGPGSDYKSMSIMKDREKAIANGLLMPDEETCKGCHNADAPGKLGESAEGFDFAKMMEKGVHILPYSDEKGE
ncbi:hypothetical protein GF356_10905 [candidate division GN15 bacterium]|nr:hypothetical protein [candidate division GN15 bacterium]